MAESAAARADERDAPLWALLARMDLPPYLQQATQLADVARAVTAAFGVADGDGDGAVLACDIVVARVPSREDGGVKGLVARLFGR